MVPWLVAFGLFLFFEESCHAACITPAARRGVQERLERVGLHHNRKCTVDYSLVAWGKATSQSSWVRMDKMLVVI